MCHSSFLSGHHKKISGWKTSLRKKVMRGNIYLIVRWQEQRDTISSCGGKGGKWRVSGVEGGVVLKPSRD